MGLVLGGRSPVVLTGHADASWADDQATQRSSQGYTFSLGSGSVSWRATRSSSVLGSSCEAEIYAGAMAAQELRWLTYLLTDLGEPPRSPPVLYVDNKAMLALCREQRLEHRTKHIALRYCLARELQQRGQLRLAYVASEANTADVFTKALAPCDHQRFCTQLVNHSRFSFLRYVSSCRVCQAMKSTRQWPAGLLQPLEPPERPLQQVTMDFVTGMPARPSGNDAVLVVVDRLTKMAHFAPCRTTITAEETERLFISTVVRLHGIPSAMISDRDPKFTSKFWKETWAEYGTKLQFSSTYHPQTDGQTERTNQTMEQLIRTNCPDPARWEDSLAMLEFAFNNAPSSTTNHSPFFLNYGMDPMVPTMTTLDNPVPRSQTFLVTPVTAKPLLPDDWRIHDAFRVSLLRKFVPATTDIARQQVAPTARPVPEPTLDPSKILAHRVRLDAAGRHVDFLIRWTDRTRAVSLDSLVVLLVQVERRGGGAGWEAGGHGGADGRERGRTSTPAAAAPVLPRGGNKQWGKYVDIRREGEAAQADKLAAVRDVIDFLAIAEETHDAAFAEANQMVRAVGESAMARIAASLGNIRFGISVCRSFSASVRESNAAMEWEEKLLRSFDAATASSSSSAAAAPAAPAANSNVAAAAAGPVAWFFSTELDSGEEVRDGEEEEVVEIMDGTLADESFPESVLSGLRSGAVDTREAAMNRLQEMVRKLMDALHAVYASFRLMRPLISYPRDASGGSGADGGAAAAAAAADGRAAVNRVVGGGGAEASQQAGNALEGRGPAEVAAGDVAAGEVAAGEVAAGEVAAGEVAAGEVAAGEAAAGEAAVGEVASGEVAPGDENISSSKPAIPVQVLCPPLESLTLQSLLFSSTPHVLWLPCNLPCTSPRMYLSPPPPPPPSYSCLPSLCSSLSSSCAPVLSTRPMSFQSIARAAVFGQLKRLHVVRCLGLEEQDWLQLLAACAKLEQLRVEQDDTFSDAVVARSRLQTLASLTVVMCEKITAASIGGVLGSFPRLRYLLVEEEKILARARRELLRAGVIVRGV
ncbi:unnamed protein product [Closterium sp. NIES-54]